MDGLSGLGLVLHSGANARWAEAEDLYERCVRVCVCVCVWVCVGARARALLGREKHSYPCLSKAPCGCEGDTNARS